MKARACHTSAAVLPTVWPKYWHLGYPMQASLPIQPTQAGGQGNLGGARPRRTLASVCLLLCPPMHQAKHAMTALISLACGAIMLSSKTLRIPATANSSGSFWLLQCIWRSGARRVCKDCSSALAFPAVVHSSSCRELLYGLTLQRSQHYGV